MFTWSNTLEFFSLKLFEQISLCRPLFLEKLKQSMTVAGLAGDYRHFVCNVIGSTHIENLYPSWNQHTFEFHIQILMVKSYLAQH